MEKSRLRPGDLVKFREEPSGISSVYRIRVFRKTKPLITKAILERLEYSKVYSLIQELYCDPNLHFDVYEIENFIISKLEKRFGKDYSYWKYKAVGEVIALEEDLVPVGDAALRILNENANSEAIKNEMS